MTNVWQFGLAHGVMEKGEEKLRTEVRNRDKRKAIKVNKSKNGKSSDPSPLGPINNVSDRRISRTQRNRTL